MDSGVSSGLGLTRLDETVSASPGLLSSQKGLVGALVLDWLNSAQSFILAVWILLFSISVIMRKATPKQFNFEILGNDLRTIVFLIHLYKS